MITIELRITEDLDNQGIQNTYELCTHDIDEAITNLKMHALYFKDDDDADSDGE